MTARHPYLFGGYASALADSWPDGLGILTVSAWADAPLIRRAVGRREGWDLASPYPFLPWDSAWSPGEGIAQLRRSGAISAVLVTDPAHPPPEAVAASADMVRAFKRHHLVETARGYRPSAHHRAELRKAARRGVEVRRSSLHELLGPWVDLYSRFIATRTAEGAIHRFSRRYHGVLAELGAELWTCWLGEQVVAAAVWLRFGPVAYYHLAAANDRGRSVSAGHAAVDAALRALSADGVEVAVLGSGLARHEAAPCSLERFKAGFATRSTVNFILGYILDEVQYRRLTASAAASDDYFPAYRAPSMALLPDRLGEGYASGVESDDPSPQIRRCSEVGKPEGDASSGAVGQRPEARRVGV